MTSREQHVEDELLRLYLEKELPAIESEKVRLHLRDCSICRARADDHKALFDLLNESIRETPLQPVWPQVEERLRKGESRHRRLVAGLAAAAGLIISVLIGPGTEQSEANVWSPLGSAFTSERDRAVCEFTQSATTEERVQE